MTLRDTNRAMLCKFVWRIKHEKSEANAFLKAWFVKKDGRFRKGGFSSSIALGVKKVWNIVEENERWIIDNGNLANFWKDKWWGLKSMLEALQLMDLPNLRFNAKVREFIHSGEWALTGVRLVDLSRFFDKILKIKIPSGGVEDMYCWSLSTLGSFSTSLAWEGWAKLNSDGCTLGNPGKAGGDGILRNAKAEVLYNYREFLGICTNFEAEFQVIIAGIKAVD
ncbi:uncharacterized protein LOC122079178 [Macadamia integrifolia]|uniref:uncharacterized protein LOC122079178 n=1 Tax=Macadamia integrifolia TaxID=60698 RepID=UPI001C4ECC0A|nr:uncharacterized protein LOC122079178 [Macadamia integrifolia]